MTEEELEERIQDVQVAMTSIVGAIEMTKSQMIHASASLTSTLKHPARLENKIRSAQLVAIDLRNARDCLKEYADLLDTVSNRLDKEEP